MSGPKTKACEDRFRTIDTEKARRGTEDLILRCILSIATSLTAIALLAVAYAYV